MDLSLPPPVIIEHLDLVAQASIRLPLPIVAGNKDYREREALLRRMDELLSISGVEQEFVQRHLEAEAKKRGGGPMSDRRRDREQRYARQALRCTIARLLAQESHRQFSIHCAESPLLQWFCACDGLGVIRVPSKSALQRMEQDVPQELLAKLNISLVRSARGVDASGASSIGLEDPVDLSMTWIDATCAKLDIHFPADWTLLRDAVRSLIGSVMLIREHGLRHRMPEPRSFTAKMNALSIAMANAGRKGRNGENGPNKKKLRKRTLRSMKTICGTVAQHARRYRQILLDDWRETDLSGRGVDRIVARIDRILDILPKAIKQAHERIIGERQVPADQKILSLYEQHAKIYVRGKAGADIEYGLQLFLSESAEGLIIDCHLMGDRIANDCTQLMPTIARIRSAFGPDAAKGVVTDRGFSSKGNSSKLADLGIEDATLPKDPQAMAKFLADPKHRELHVRRAQTEARIGIFKAKFLGEQIPTKGEQAQQRYVAWAMLAHNLWVLARLQQRKPLAATG